MTNKEAINILMEYNTWRRGEKVIELPITGKTIGEAIDHAICSLNRLEVDTSEVVMSKKIELLNKITKEATVLQQLVSKYNSFERGYGPLYAFENIIAEIRKTARNVKTNSKEIEKEERAMSLDFYIYVPEKRSYYRSGGKTLPMAKYDDCFTRCYVDNITHNLGEMARHIPLSDKLTLYNVLWRPEESGLTTTDDIVDLVAEGVRYMITHKDDLIKYNSDNGWGDYDGLLEFAKQVGKACLFNPSCRIEAVR